MALPTPAVVLGPWPKGIVNTVSDRALPADALDDAVNCDIDREGYIYPRSNLTVLDNANGFYSLFELNGEHFAVSQGFVGRLTASSFDTISSVTGPVGWTDYEGTAVYCDYNGVYQINGVAAVRFVTRPPADCEDRYDFIDLPGGSSVAYWKGRFLVLRGRSLIWSEPLDYGSFSSARNFVRFGSTPTWMAPVEGGVFVGLRDSVVFLRGTDPANFNLSVVSGPPSPGGVALTTTEDMTDSGGGRVAIWFAETGFVVGRPDGSVVYPQAGSIRGLPIVPRNISIVGERVYAFATEE